MSNILKTGFLLLVLLASATIQAVELNEANINQFLDEVDTTISELDIDSYEKFISDDAKYIVTFIFQGRRQAMPYSKKRYIREIRKVLPSMEDYQQSRSNTEIKITDNKAIVTALISTSATINSRTRSTKSESEVTIEVVNDKLLITKLVGDLGVFTTG